MIKFNDYFNNNQNIKKIDLGGYILIKSTFETYEIFKFVT